MLLTLTRQREDGKAVHGILTENGRVLAYTLENKDYLISESYYPVRVTYSPRFDQPLPLIKQVLRKKDDPALGFRTGIRIHNGYKPRHSEGCVLLTPSSPMRQVELTRMLQVVQADGEEIRIHVTQEGN